METNNEKAKHHAKEIAWIVSNSIIDNGDKELGDIKLSVLLKIRDIVENETYSYLKDVNINNFLNKY